MPRFYMNSLLVEVEQIVWLWQRAFYLSMYPGTGGTNSGEKLANQWILIFRIL